MSGFRERLEMEVKRLGVSEIARVLGVARNTIYNWIAEANVPLDKLMALGGMGADLQFIVTGVRNPRAADEAGSYQLDKEVSAPLSKEEESLVVKYRLLDRKSRAHTQAVVDAMASVAKNKDRTGS